MESHGARVYARVSERARLNNDRREIIKIDARQFPRYGPCYIARRISCSRDEVKLAGDRLPIRRCGSAARRGGATDGRLNRPRIGRSSKRTRRRLRASAVSSAHQLPDSKVTRTAIVMTTGKNQPPRASSAICVRRDHLAVVVVVVVVLFFAGRN